MLKKYLLPALFSSAMVVALPLSATPRDVSHATSADVRLDYLGRMLDSKSGQRLKEQDPETARKIAEMLANARQAAANGDEATANSLGKEGLSLIMKAVQKMPENSEETARHKQRYDNLRKGLEKFVSAQQTNMERFEGDPKGNYNTQQVEKLFADAESLAGAGQYQEAIALLNDAHGILTASLQGLLNNKELVIKLDISTPEKEWAYEVRRYSGYEPLIPIAVEVKKPEQFVVDKMLSLSEKAKWMSEQAHIKANEENYPYAIRMMMDATNVLRQALRLAGVTM